MSSCLCEKRMVYQNLVVGWTLALITKKKHATELSVVYNFSDNIFQFSNCCNNKFTFT